MKNSSKVGLTLGAAVLTLGGVAGVTSLAQAADPSASPTPSTTAGTGDASSEAGRHGRGGKPGMRGAEMAGALATKLGLEETKVAEALRTAHDALHQARESSGDEATRPSRDERDAALAAELAKALGVEESRVTDALAAMETERGAERAAALQERLDAAVTDGTLTQAEADAVKKAVQAGVIGGGGGRR
ncbi:MAG: hypothetical protein ACLGHZ_01395 [Actinomycetes bacterium]